MPSTGCLVHHVLTVGHVLIDAHEREMMRAGALFRVFGDISADVMIGSKTTRGDLLTVLDDSGRIERHWAYDQ
jgi:hypothetical protein